MGALCGRFADEDRGMHRVDIGFERLKANEEVLNCIFIELYGLQDELTPEVEGKEL